MGNSARQHDINCQIEVSLAIFATFASLRRFELVQFSVCPLLDGLITQIKLIFSPRVPLAVKAEKQPPVNFVGFSCNGSPAYAQQDVAINSHRALDTGALRSASRLSRRAV